MFAMSEVRLVCWILLVLWISNRGFAAVAQHTLEVRASVGAQWAMWSLLETQYDAVVQLGSDMRIQGALPRLKGLLALDAASSNTQMHEVCTLPSVKDAPVYSFMPMPSSDDGKALEGRLLSDFMASNDDRLQFRQSLCVEVDSDDEEGMRRTQVCHLNIRDALERSRPARVYHVGFRDLSGTKACHLVGICVNSELETSTLQNDEVVPCGPLHQPQATASSTSQGPLLIFDPMDLEGAVVYASEEWVTVFGKEEYVLKYFRPDVCEKFQAWLQRVVNETMAAPWSADKSTFTFGHVKIADPKGSKKAMKLMLTLPDPAEYFNEVDATYMAMLRAEPVSTHRRSGNASRSSRSSRSNLSSRSGSKGNVNPLPSVAEDIADESSENVRYRGGNSRHSQEQ